MDSKDYEIILSALNNMNPDDSLKDDVKKLKRKIELFQESEKVRIEYQETMDKIGKEIQDIMTNKE